MLRALSGKSTPTTSAAPSQAGDESRTRNMYPEVRRVHPQDPQQGKPGNPPRGPGAGISKSGASAVERYRMPPENHRQPWGE